MKFHLTYVMSIEWISFLFIGQFIFSFKHHVLYAQNQLNLSNFTFGRNYHQLYGNYSTMHTRIHIMVILIPRDSSQMPRGHTVFFLFRYLFPLFVVLSKIVYLKRSSRDPRNLHRYSTHVLTIFLHV